MSSIVNKIKEAVHSDKKSTEAPEGTHGTHNSRAANAADPRIDSDRDHRAAPGSSTTGTHTGTHTGAGYGTTSGTTEGTHGPHDSKLANTVDPRVDSDRDGSHTVGNTGNTGNAGYGQSGTYGATGTHSHGVGAPTHTTGHNTTHGTTEGSHGPHDSKIANTVDPRVDSDRDGSRTVGNTGNTGNAGYGQSGTYGATGAHSHGVGAPTHTTGHNTTHGTTEGSHGPHDSKIANTVDPRVDSDRDGSRTVGNTGHSTTHGTTNEYHGPGSVQSATGTGSHALPGTTSHQYGPGTGATPGTNTSAAGIHPQHGTHDSHATHGTHGTHESHGHQGAYDTTGVSHNTAPGPAPSTAGPHKSNLLNKVDPRVDSDLDGSKTTGGNKTYAS